MKILDEVKDVLKQHLKDVTDNVDSVKTEIGNQVSALEETTKTQNAETNKRLDNLESNVELIGSAKSGNQAERTFGYKNHTEFFTDVINHARNKEVSDKFKNIISNASTSDAEGGFLIPPAFLPDILKRDGLALQDDLGARITTIPMEYGIVEIPARVDSNHKASVSGGFKVYRRKEAEKVKESSQKFELIKLEAASLMGLSFATNEILSRSPLSFAALIQSGFSDEIKSKLNEERIWGTGTGEFLGVMNSKSLVGIAKDSGQAANTITFANIVKMRARCWGYNNAVWMANHDVLPALMSLTDGDGNKLWQPSLREDAPDMLLGRPILFDENMKTLGEQGDIGLFNWSQYLEGWQGGIDFAESLHVRFDTNESAFRFTAYNDGAPWWNTPLTPKRSNASLSPFVTLAERK